MLTKQRMAVACSIAILADLIEFPITTAEVTMVAAPAAEDLTGELAASRNRSTAARLIYSLIDCLSVRASTSPRITPPQKK